MITFDFKMDRTGHIEKIVLDFDGLTGEEKVSTIKEALTKMAIENTAKTFAVKIKSGEYDKRFTEEELKDIAGFSDFAASVWNTDYDPGIVASPYDLQPYMTCLHLLENCFNLILKQWRMINELRSKCGENDPAE